jgi:OPA family glycerol-3-phosphate transporter-like MFS transporter/OPA family sugar phosphate sensor protein UhpC-like MFS transporter
MAYWFSPRDRASTFGIWHASHMIGAACVGTLSGFLDQYMGWRWCFYIPAALATIGAVIVLIFLRDTPGSMGLPPVEVYKGEEAPEELAAELKEPVVEPEEGVVYTSGEPPMTYWQILWKYILLSPYMWLISFANLAVYVLRYAQITWGPTFLQETKGFSKVQAGWLFFGSEMGGLCGALAGGFLADKLFRGRAGRVCVIAMLGYLGIIQLFRFSPRSAPLLSGTTFVLMGFLLYVPQMLIAAMAMNLGTKRASAAAVGLTGIIGYASTIITGWGIGKLVDTHGWGAAFQMMLGCATITLVLMAFTWNVGAHPHAKDGH